MPENTLAEYGIWAFVALILLRETLPFLVKAIFPARAEEKRVENERRARIDQEERAHRRGLEERSIRATEEIARATQSTRLVMESMRVLLETVNQRLSALEEDTSWLRESISMLLDREGMDVPTRPIRKYRYTPPPGTPGADPAAGHQPHPRAGISPDDGTPTGNTPTGNTPLQNTGK